MLLPQAMEGKVHVWAGAWGDGCMGRVYLLESCEETCWENGEVMGMALRPGGIGNCQGEMRYLVVTAERQRCMLMSVL